MCCEDEMFFFNVSVLITNIKPNSRIQAKII